MAIASWIAAALLKERDWPAALAQMDGDVLELGAALEYIEPDRRRAIEVYELSPEGLPRARELAIEVGWWGGPAARPRRELETAARDRDPAALHAYLKRRLDDLELVPWVDAARAIGMTLLEIEQHRGYALRLLRLALERAYEHALADIPGHLAIWEVLNARAKADHTRRELLPLAGIALEATPNALDQVWIAALATEICLRDAKHPVTAGAYADLVREHAPEHPILTELERPKVVPPKFNLRGIPPKPPDPPNAKVRANRVAIAIDVRLPGGVTATSRDVSTSGLFITTDADLDVGSTLAIELLVPGKEAFTEDEHRTTARVVRRDTSGYGLELVAPDGALVAALSALK